MMARAYIEGGWEAQGDVVPQVVSLALAMGVSKAVIYQWAKDPDKKEFVDILTRVQQAQEQKLINGGLSGGFNPAVTKMLLCKHGYSDKVEQDHTSSDRSMTPKPSLDVSKLSTSALAEILAAQDQSEK
jgi:hypothetical protein